MKRSEEDMEYCMESEGRNAKTRSGYTEEKIDGMCKKYRCTQKIDPYTVTIQ